MPPLLLLWDIDSTLITTDGAGTEALRQGLLNQFGVIDDLGDIEMAGRTDTSISVDICKKHAEHQIDPSELLEAYLEHLAPSLKSRKGRVFPGVRELLDWSHDHLEVHNALLTGNIERGAKIKLGHFDLNRFFEFGAFGSDSSDRNQLGPIVLERARTRLKKDFQINRTWVIGDTPKDIACARAVGCRVLAVATGHYTVEELATHKPDHVREDLSDFGNVIQILEAQ